MVETLESFAKFFGVKISLNKNFVRKGNRYFLLDERLRALAKEISGWQFAGAYLGKNKNGKFYPSSLLLFMITDQAENKIIVDDKAAWLFVCGRDIFKEGIMRVYGSKTRGAYTLVLNKHGECLGFGRITENLDEAKEGVVVENVSDIGDFLRRERTPKQ
ncbi:hypothetical protein KEJ45_00850 [Candidatus Bathyarchaeota archaeon]|nr:hypothetical protein [Candidatus Bathyarchaeota archaeon]